MKIQTRGNKWHLLLVLLPVVIIAALAIATSAALTATAAAYTDAGCTMCGLPISSQYGLDDQMLFIANGRASNVAVVDVGSMSIVDFIPVPRPLNAGAVSGQLNATLDKTLAGLGLKAPVSMPDMYYWEVHGVVPSADRSSIYAVGALSVTDADFTMYQVDTKTHQNTRKIPMAPSVVGYCGLEYDLNDENSGLLYGTSMEVGPADAAQLIGLPLQLRDPVAGLLNTLGLNGLLNTVENTVSTITGGLSEENISSGTNTRYISTDYNADGSASTCGIAWNAAGTVAYASQFFEPLVDTIDWHSKTLTGEILPTQPYRPTDMHQATSAKSRDLVITANGVNGVAFFDMNLNAMVGQIDINALIGRGADVHGVEVAPGNDNILYVFGRSQPVGAWIVDISSINAPKLLGGIEGFDPNACGVYAIPDKQSYYEASGKCARPDLTVNKVSAYWASFTDYQNRKISVDYSLAVRGGTDARNVVITGATVTNGVTVDSSMPMNLGNVTPVQGNTATIVYNVPSGVGSFRSSLTASAQSPCGDSYDYPTASVVGEMPAAPQA